MTWISPRTFVAGEVVTAAELNEIRDSLKAIGDPWAAYTPVVSNFTLGNGTLTGKALQAGKLTLFTIEFTFGSTSTATGTLQFTLPSTAAGAGVAGYPIDGRGWVYDASVPGHGYYTPTLNTTGSSVVLRDAAGALVNSTTIAWATGDKCVIRGSYEAA